MKVLMLVLSSDTFPVYSHQRDVWRSYRMSHPDVDCYFLESRPLVFLPTLTSDTLTLRGVERYDTILAKTLEGLEYFLRRKAYDYVVRTNLSSVWDFKALLAYLQTLPRARVYSGQIGTHAETGLRFASGAGILMSTDVARTLLVNRQTAMSLSSLDDVAIAKALLVAGLTPTPLPRVDFLNLAHYDEHHTKSPPGAFHYRVRQTGSRVEEPEIMRRILRDHILVP